MGLFDEIVCEYPLPDGWIPPAGTVFQTKDTDDQYLVRFTLCEDGKLRRANGEVLDHHGAVEFYTSNVSGSAPWGFLTEDDKRPWFAEYIALFDHGRLLKIEGRRALDPDAKWLSREEWFTKSREADAAASSGRREKEGQ